MKRVILFVVAIAVVVAVAAFAVPNNAAVVNGTTITQSQLNDQLQAIANSGPYQCYLYVAGASGAFPIVGAGNSSAAVVSSPQQHVEPSSYSSNFAGYWLTEMVRDQLYAQADAKLGITLTSADLAIARGGLLAQMDQAFNQASSTYGSSDPCPAETGTEALSSLPAWFSDQLVLGQARQYAYLLSAASLALSPQGIAAYYARHHHQFDAICVEALAFDSDQSALAAVKQLAAGTPFASVAAGQAVQQGCVSAATSSIGSVLQGDRVGQVIPPIQVGQSTWAVFEVTSIHPTPLTSKLTTAVLIAMVDDSASAAGGKVAELQHSSHVSVDPRYGHWVSLPTRQYPGAALSVVPPESPPASSTLCPAANTYSLVPAVCPPSPTRQATVPTGASESSGYG